MTKSDIFYHDMSRLLKNKKNAFIMANNSHSHITQVEQKKKHYTTHDIKRADHARQFKHITGQPMKQVLYAVENNILQNFPNLRENVVMTE